MITFLHGKLVTKQPTRLVVDVNGVGYELQIPISSYDKLPTTGHDCHILTYVHIREDAHILFGFMTEAERAMFLLLLGVSGIGPKLALSALSGLTVRELTQAISNGDVKRLSSISGLGKKTAERLIVDLRDKLDSAAVLAARGLEPVVQDQRLRDAVLALISLGYKDAQAHKMAADVMERNTGADFTLADVLKQALAR